jgi:hypothetical protein
MSNTLIVTQTCPEIKKLCYQDIIVTEVKGIYISCAIK